MTARRETGFSLVEVLVSMFVVSMGILALAALLQSATRYAKMSEARSAATLLANDLADRLRANPVGARLGSAGGYDMTARGFPSAVPAARQPCTSRTPCDPVELAQDDLAQWTARLRATLPQGSALIRFRAGVAPAPDSVDLWVGWADPGASSVNVSRDGSGTECPPEWAGAAPPARCVYLQVAP